MVNRVYYLKMMAKNKDTLVGDVALMQKNPTQRTIQEIENDRENNEKLKKLGIVKIQPSIQGSKLRQDTNMSRQTDRTNNTLISNSGY